MASGHTPVVRSRLAAGRQALAVTPGNVGDLQVLRALFVAREARLLLELLGAMKGLNAEQVSRLRLLAGQLS